MTRFILLCFLITAAFNINGQEIKNEYIITLKRGQIDRFLDQITKTESRSISRSRVLSADLNVVEIQTAKGKDIKFEQSLNNNPIVKRWGYNMRTHTRATPDDEYYDLQWGLELIEASAAWDVTTGGSDINGKEIVIAVLDDGFDLNHPEIADQILYNTDEIPDDGIDNDNNGYIDDHVGWNGQFQDDRHPFENNHGIAVSGIIGAKTDNELGVSGVNWNVKILPISGIGSVSDVIASYQYVLDLRRQFNESNGAEGAFIVATNYSAGIDSAFPTSPNLMAWCEMYDALGEQGILSAGATTNANRDVDIEGDIPTTCQSPYLISVTNVDIEDTKVTNAGYGALNIDLGAPGRGTFALDVNAGYDQNFSGTSAATPHVAGTIGLLYSAPCQSLADMAFTNPSQAAIEIRDAILTGVTPNSTLEGITTTGGRLNIYNAMEKLQEVCSELQLPSAKGPLEITKIQQQENNNLQISYITPDESPYSLLVSDTAGKTISHTDFTPPSIGRKQIIINIPNPPTGIYFISIYNDNKISTEKLFINN
ncbi:MAG: subtilisin family serine protease [Saprospiraceae bacterium]|jgi:subtilisin family serine protease|tara:strand:+ start:584 stop:2200 length:1617 start_codon:yes stop_codon:yes gene_type:complete